MTGNVPTENIQNRTWCSVNWLAYSTLPSGKQADTQGITWRHVSSEARGWVNAPVFLHSSEMTHRDNFSPSSCLEVWAVTVTVLQSTHVLPALQSSAKKLKCQENRPDYSAATKEKLRFILVWRLLLGLHEAPGRTSAYQKPVDRYPQALLSILVGFSKQNVKINICKLLKHHVLKKP